ncbi:hypothetical protein MACH15_09280 [Maricaulis maris]|nr:hypothetical protein MACH15_09280 [Maricaulis maris]
MSRRGLRAGSPLLGPLPTGITTTQLWNDGTPRRRKRIRHAPDLTVCLVGMFDNGLLRGCVLVATAIPGAVGVRPAEPCDRCGLQVNARRLSGLLILDHKRCEHCGGNQAGGHHGVSPLTSPMTPGLTLAEQAAPGNAHPNWARA